MMIATMLPVLSPPEALAACSMVRLPVVVVAPTPAVPEPSVVVGRSEELVAGSCAPAESSAVVVEGPRRTDEVGDDLDPDPVPAEVVVWLERELAAEVDEVDERSLVVELDDLVVLVEFASVVVEPSSSAVVVVVGGRVMTAAPAGASAIPTSTIATRHTTTAARCRTPTLSMVRAGRYRW